VDNTAPSVQFAPPDGAVCTGPLYWPLRQWRLHLFSTGY